MEYPELSSEDAYGTLTIFVELLNDVERTRIAAENRYRSLTSEWIDDDGVIHGYGLSPTLRQCIIVATHCAALSEMETDLIKALQQRMRMHPLWPWASKQVGIGEKQFARLLGAIGDPADREMVSQLWHYCGQHVVNPTDQLSSENHTTTVGGVAPFKQRGVQMDWNPNARMRIHLIAESCMKQRSSPYRRFYDFGREKYKNSTHNTDCVRCGPAGKPAKVGSPLSDAHKHARALRLVAKEILRDMWVEAKRLAVEVEVVT